MSILRVTAGPWVDIEIFLLNNTKKKIHVGKKEDIYIDIHGEHRFHEKFT